jgi:hypothetical protein
VITSKIKYPRTFHIPGSPGATSDDKILNSLDHFVGREVVISYKMDGENSTLYRDHFHARSLDSRHHPSRDWLKKFHGDIAHLIPETYRICGENLYARHSIAYDNLLSYFYGFSVWEDKQCLSWEDTELWFNELGIFPVPVLYLGIFDIDIVKLLTKMDTNVHEGFVIRITDSFQYDDFKTSIAKWVRPNHVQSEEHWMNMAVIPNGLRNE